MAPRIDQRELHRLFVGKADGSLSPEEHTRLCAVLHASPELRREWFLFIDAETAFQNWAQRQSSLPGVFLHREPVLPEKTSAWKRPWFGWAAGIALGGALLAGGYWMERFGNGSRDVARVEQAREVRSNAVAVLARGAGMEWEIGEAAPGVDTPLCPGVLRLKSGVAEIEFFTGARLCMEGPAEVGIVSGGEAFCARGRVSVHVPPQARGFKLATPKGDIVDLGTDFGVDLSGGAADLLVFSGEVELHQGGTPMRRLFTGAAVDLGKPGAPQLLAVNTDAFSFSRELAARVNASESAALERWKQQSERWNEDSALRVHLDFQDPPASRNVRNSAVHGTDIAAGAIVGCQWTAGRWSGKHALQFRSVSDRVRLSVPGEYAQLTLSTWVQLHSLNARQSQSSLCMSQGIEPNTLHWQVLHDGAVCLGILKDGASGDVDDYISPVVFSPERFGQWTHLAVVIDAGAGEVRFYVNGDNLGVHPLKRPSPVRIGLAELGNWTPSPSYNGPQPVRNLAGSMDDFSLFTRALSEAEIRTLAR